MSNIEELKRKLEEAKESLKVLDEDKQNLDAIFSKYTELPMSRKDMENVLLEHGRVVIDSLLSDPQLKFREYTMLSQGLCNRSLLLFQAILREIANENFIATTSLLRSQCETLAACCYVEENPHNLESVLYGSRDAQAEIKSPNILTQIDHADRKFKRLRLDYDQLSEVLHPNFLSHFSAAEIVSKDGVDIGIKLSLPGSLKKEDAVEMIKMAYMWTKWFLVTCRKMDAKCRPQRRSWGFAKKLFKG